MQYHLNRSIIETDDLDKLRDMRLQTVNGEQQIVLTFSLREKRYGENEAPNMVFLTNGVSPRMLLVEGLAPLPAAPETPAPEGTPSPVEPAAPTPEPPTPPAAPETVTTEPPAAPPLPASAVPSQAAQ